MYSLFSLFPKPYMVGEKGFLFLRADTKDGHFLFEDNSIDFWYNDGNHDNLGNDIDLWKPKIKSKGIISGHDYNTTWPLVTKDVNNRFTKVNTIDSIWYTQK